MPCVPTEEWLYDRGPGNLMATVRLRNGRIWTITSGFPALAAHVLVRPGDDCHAKRRELESLLKDGYAIEHTTLQVDHASDPAGVIGVDDVRPGLRGRSV